MARFVEDITKMMYVCGDCACPSLDSAVMIDNITHQQMVQLAVKALDGARQRNVLGSEVKLSVEDIFFLMRRNKEKVKRLLYQIEFKTQARRASGGNRQEGDSVAGGRGEESGRKGLCVDSEFLSDMFGSDFYTTEEAVQLQQNRMERHDSRTRGMEPDEYLNYVQCRQVSFVKNLGRFRKWLDLDAALGGNNSPAHDVMEVLGYLAYDTVRELVELSLLVKQDMERSRRNFISPHLLPPSSSHPHTLTTSQSPSSHNSTELPIGGHSSQESERVETAATTRTSRSSTRKRKKSVSVDGSNDPIPVPEDSAQDQSQNGMRTEESGSGIQPSHIREALRRLNVPSGPLVPLASHRHWPNYTQTTPCL